MRMLGILLVIVGLVGIIWGGASYIKNRESTKIGPLEIVVEEKGRVPIPPIVGAVCLIAGGLLVGASSRGRKNLIA